jgi:translation initiation factor 2A
MRAQEGPVHDVQWHPSGDYFVTVAGFMPAKTTLFTDACKPHFDLGSGPHNIARWSPQACGLPFESTAI